MTEKELKKLNRYQLLELIILQTEQLNEVQLQLEKTQKDLEAQQIRVSQTGSIADAALQLSGIFEAAQTAADLYLENVKIHTQNAEQIEEDAKAKADKYISDAETSAKKIVDDAQAQAISTVQKAQAEAAAAIQQAQEQADEIIRKADALMADTVRSCTEKENAVKSYIDNIKQAFHLQFQNLDQITQSRTE